MAREIADRRVYAENQVIFREGQDGFWAFLVNYGKVEISRQGEKGRQVIAHVGEREIFGEMALIDDAPRMATATALEPTECALIGKDQLLAKLDKVDHDTRMIINFLLNYIRNTNLYNFRTDLRDGGSPNEKDATASVIVASKEIALNMQKLDPFLRGFFEALINYTIRRLPPYLVDEELD